MKYSRYRTAQLAKPKWNIHDRESWVKYLPVRLRWRLSWATHPKDSNENAHLQNNHSVMESPADCRQECLASRKSSLTKYKKQMFKSKIWKVLTIKAETAASKARRSTPRSGARTTVIAQALKENSQDYLFTIASSIWRMFIPGPWLTAPLSFSGVSRHIFMIVTLKY